MALLFGAVVVRSAGVYLAMLSLALAQVVWAIASQWVSLTGGDNGLIGLRLVPPEGRMAFYFLLLSLAFLWVWATSEMVHGVVRSEEGVVVTEAGVSPRAMRCNAY